MAKRSKKNPVNDFVYRIFFDLFAIPPFKIRVVLFVIPFLVIDDLWKLPI